MTFRFSFEHFLNSFEMKKRPALESRPLFCAFQLPFQRPKYLGDYFTRTVPAPL